MANVFLSEAGAKEVNTVEAEVSGIIYYTPEERPYPFFANEDGYTVLASTGFLAQFSPEALSNPALVGADQQGGEGQFAFALSQCPTMYGETHVNVYTDEGANAVESAASVIKAGKSYGMGSANYNEENWNLYFSAWNTAVVLGMLGGTSLMIALMILWNIHLSAFEQERPRIGVLQALGVANGKFIRDRLFWGMKCGAASLLADEPTGNLDEKTSREVMGLLRESARAFRQTMVLVTHEKEIAGQAGRVVTISDGRIQSIQGKG